MAKCEVEAGLRSASQLERTCRPSVWEAVANRIQRARGPPVNGMGFRRAGNLMADGRTSDELQALMDIMRGRRWYSTVDGGRARSLRSGGRCLQVRS